MSLLFEKMSKHFTDDSLAHRYHQGLEVFYSAWPKEYLENARTTEIFQVRGGNSTENAQKIHDEILETPFYNVSQNKMWMPEACPSQRRWWCLEKKYLDGVTDNTAHVFLESLALIGVIANKVSYGSRLWLCLPKEVNEKAVQDYARKVFYNELIEECRVVTKEEAKECLFKLKEKLYKTPATHGLVNTFKISHLSLDELEALSSKSLWALSRTEMQVIQEYFKSEKREPTDVEIEVLAQTWSEHCKHKIFSADVLVKNERSDVQIPEKVESIFKTYIKGATKNANRDFLKSVFEDNAGIFQVSDDYLCALKVETHNSPSALDPYGGALTGIVGVNRDILGAGLGAEPIANLDVFCVGPQHYGEHGEVLPEKLHHPKRILEGVRTGVEHGGNKSGIPTITGAVVFHPQYVGKPLVFCGTIGLLPTRKDFVTKEIRPGDLIVMSGGRIGKDGIHGATFSSLELNESSPVTAVQLGDPLTQKRVWDFLVEARDLGLFRAVTDNGAGGLSSSVGELARLCGDRGGAVLDVTNAPTKYEGLLPFELIVSESQERMTFAVPKENIEEFIQLSKRRGVESTVLGEFINSGFFEMKYRGETVGKLSMEFLHEGVPKMQLEALIKKPQTSAPRVRFKMESNLHSHLLKVLSDPNVCSRKNIVRQYDHEVQARTVQKPYGNFGQHSPGDGGALRLSRKTYEGVAVGLGLAPDLALVDMKVSAEASVVEAISNAVASGADPDHMVLVDNFCWPDPTPSAHNPDAKEKMGALVLTCERLYEAASVLQMPFVSGKDSMKNDFRMGDVKISVPPTILVTALGKVQDVRAIPRSYFLEEKEQRIYWIAGVKKNSSPWTVSGLSNYDFQVLKNYYRALHEQIQKQYVRSLHDVSEGGYLTATAEMFLSAACGVELQENLELKKITAMKDRDAFFAELPAGFVVAAEVKHASDFERAMKDYFCAFVGETSTRHQHLHLKSKEESVTWTRSELISHYETRYD